MVRLLAALRTVLDPALVVHLAKLLRAQSYAHVAPRRAMTAGPGLAMSPTASLRNGERIVLGRDVHVGERCCLWAGDSTGRILLGDHALLAPEVFITASNYGTRAGEPVMHQVKVERDVVVGADVWLGARVVVLPGVTIGDGAIVGAGSVVTKDLPAQCIAVGVPARVVGWREGAEPVPGEQPVLARPPQPGGLPLPDAELLTDDGPVPDVVRSRDVAAPEVSAG